MKLYQLPQKQYTKLYFKDMFGKYIVLIFDHIDGMYSYCWIEKDWLEKGEKKIVPINNCTKIAKYKDGYKLKVSDK